jgi:hypothetical protein
VVGVRINFETGQVQVSSSVLLCLCSVCCVLPESRCTAAVCACAAPPSLLRCDDEPDLHLTRPHPLHPVLLFCRAALPTQYSLNGEWLGIAFTDVHSSQRLAVSFAAVGDGVAFVE